MMDYNLVLEGYDVPLTIKKKEGSYYVSADMFFLVASVGETIQQCIERIINIFNNITNLIIKELLENK